MFCLSLGQLGASGRRTAAWSPAALWPTGTEAGMWIDPSYTSASYQNSTGTTPLSSIGTVADSSNPVGLILDCKAGATVLAAPGLHLSNATSTARPLCSARKNKLTKTEDFNDGIWSEAAYGSGTIAKTPNYALAPDGTMTACRVLATAPTGSDGGVLRYGAFTASGISHARQIYIKSNTGIAQTITFAAGIGAEGLVTIPATGWSVVNCDSSDFSYLLNLGLYRPEGTDATCDVSIWHPQIETGAMTAYQRVNTASDYTATGFPIYDQFDGVDDGLSTATFPAGTLTISMDCLIAVRRDSAALVMLGLYEATGGSKFSGIAESGNAIAASAGCGTPTVWVDGVQLTGGTAVTRATLHTALAAGAFHILEFRGLDLSSWTALGYGNGYSGHLLNGGFGGIRLFPSTTDAIRNAARTELAAKVGLTL